MQEFFKKYDLELSDSELQKFEKFLSIFMEKNAQINLSAIRDEAGIIEKHFVDSIMLAALFELQPSSQPSPLGEKEQAARMKIADMGTGGGFPGIPLAIVTPNAEFALIDSVAKKLKCVSEFAEQLELENVTTVNGRAEEIGQEIAYRERFDLVVSRATAYFPTLLEYTIPLLKVGGVLAAYKLTDKQELQSIKKALKRLGAKILKVKNYTLAEQERSIIFIEKIEKTNKKYPRKVGIPLKEPIV
ncbi:16S rRNA (guanine(527)-N(7))-methyltransferase RsmG [Candidatus Gracilibacteria bacterium]|nr:16S rRNA (guanine(527)-N(7))-methyltransferase RsmG [Candidatus Gracilibacteria bacterium]